MTSTTNDSSFSSPRHVQFWAGKELWSFFELQVICCHLVPHLPETLNLTDGEGYGDELLEARQTIERGVFARIELNLDCNYCMHNNYWGQESLPG